MSLFTPTASLAPEAVALYQTADEQLTHHVNRCNASGPAVGLSAEARRGWQHLLTVSRYVERVLHRQPELLREPVWRWQSARTIEARLASALVGVQDEPALYRVLRQWRQACQLRLLWAQLNDQRPTWLIARGASAMAASALQLTLDWLTDAFRERWGAPAVVEGVAPQLVILGMGKLGAGELNLSSDIDLIMAYSTVGETIGGKRALSHQEYFTRVGQALIRALDTSTEDGRVFRVDMRLRPFGEAGPLVSSFPALERYYQQHGREWERYALLKARPVAGDRAAGKALLAMLTPFVYRRYIDFSVIEALRDMKQRIQREVRQRGREQDIKLGEGGIRSLEFIVQAGQLIHGGRHVELRTSSLRKALHALAAQALMSAQEAHALEQDYLWLRALEHALQAIDDAQTQQLPADEASQRQLLLMLGRADWQTLLDDWQAVRQRVQRSFESLIAAPETVDDPVSRFASPWMMLWEGSCTDDEAITELGKAGFHAPAQAWASLRALADSHAVAHMQAIGRERLDRLMPLLLDDIATLDHDHSVLRYTETLRHEQILTRLSALIEAVSRRTAYLALLWENKGARRQLIRLCAISPWVAAQLIRYPVLLDELLDLRMLETALTPEDLQAELDQLLNRLPIEDEEGILEALRQFRHAQLLRIAVADLFGQRTLMEVSDALTCVAEVLLSRVLAMAWRTLTQRYGVPTTNESDDEAGFIIVAYGKLGSIELGYDSDLDLVFLHDADPQGVTVDGPRSLDNSLFMARLGQRIIHLLSAMTPSGTLYEVDMRLRPSGKAGLLVSSLKAFDDYQQRHAWLWEQQALVRARAVAGSASLCQAFERVRRTSLARLRDKAMVQQAVVAMRDKMHQHAQSDDIKRMPGGLIDIEFITQYAVLAFAKEQPALLAWTDNVRLLAMMARCGILTFAEEKALRAVLLDYRRRMHAAALLQHPVDEASPLLASQQATVRRSWQRLLLS